jgi:hypothetical protein
MVKTTSCDTRDVSQSPKLACNLVTGRAYIVLFETDKVIWEITALVR